jgi:lysozyme
MSAKHLIAGGIIGACVAFIAPNEGLRLHAYHDPVGILTICDGETQGVYPGETKTPEQCRRMLQSRIEDYLGPVDKMMPGLPDNARVAYTDFAYNTGVARLRTSRIPTLEREKQHVAACTELLRYVYGGHKLLPGLVARRRRENALCLSS